MSGDLPGASRGKMLGRGLGVRGEQGERQEADSEGDSHDTRLMVEAPRYQLTDILQLNH